MSLSVAELAAVIAELQALRGGAVQKVYAPRERVVVLELRQPGASSLLMISAEPGLTRIHRAEARPPSPAEALPFQQMARAHLVGRRLTELQQREGDRVVELTFADAEGTRRLVAELTGRHGNIALMSGSGVILSLSGRNLSQLRDLRVGQPYVPPLEPARASPAPKSRFSAQGSSISAQIEAAYSRREQELEQVELRRRLQRPLQSRKARLERTLEKVKVEADRTQQAEVHRLAGELLKQNLHRLRRGQSTARLVDYSSGEPVEVEVALRPELSPADNLERHFRQYRRLRSGSTRAAERLAQLQGELAGLEEQLRGIEALDIDSLRASQAPAAAAPREHAKVAAHRAYKELVGWNGQRIWVGKSAADNDQLTFKHARGHDLWLHVRGPRGAHVVVPLERGREVPQELLLDAAAAAVHFSESKDEALVEVVFVPAQRVRRIKGGAPGQVSYTQEKTLRYRVEPQRIARLLASQVEG